MSERKYDVEMPESLHTIKLYSGPFAEGRNEPVLLAKDVLAMRDKAQDVIDELRLTNGKSLLTLHKAAFETIPKLEAELAAERERSNNLAREVAILRVDSAKAREEALREAAAVVDRFTCGGSISILALIEPKEGGAK